MVRVRLLPTMKQAGHFKIAQNARTGIVVNRGLAHLSTREQGSMIMPLAIQGVICAKAGSVVQSLIIPQYLGGLLHAPVLTVGRTRASTVVIQQRLACCRQMGRVNLVRQHVVVVVFIVTQTRLAVVVCSKFLITQQMVFFNLHWIIKEHQLHTAGVHAPVIRVGHTSKITPTE